MCCKCHSSNGKASQIPGGRGILAKSGCYQPDLLPLETSGAEDKLLVEQHGNMCPPGDSKSEEGDVTPKLSLIPIILERAGAVPLNIHVFSDFPTENHWNTILPLIARAARVCCTLEIKVNYLPRYLGIFSEPNSLPKLRYLRLEWDRGGNYSGLEGECIDLSRATSITFLSISFQAQGVRNNLLSLRLPEVCTLKTLYLEGNLVPADVISAVTCCASQLKWLTLYVDDWPLPDTDPADRTVQETQMPAALQLSHLRHLRMKGRSLVLMHAISAPKLQSLAITSYGISMEAEHWTRYPHPLSATQQFPGLLDLQVPHQIPENILIPYLAAHPTLKTVGTVGIVVTRWALFGHDTPLPNLRHLWVNCFGMRAEDVSALRDLAIRLRAASSSSGGLKCILHLKGSKRNFQEPAGQETYTSFNEILTATGS